MNKSHSIYMIIIILMSTAITIAGWSTYNQPIIEPAWPDTTRGMAFSPYQLDQDGSAGIMPEREQIKSDLALLADQTRSIRTYTTEAIFSDIPMLADEYDLNVTIGAWIDQREEHNKDEITRAMELSLAPNVSKVIIGNEVLLRNEISINKLTAYLDDARTRTEKPVSTAEIWSMWMQYPQLAEHVDFIAVHILPYWEGINIAAAISFTADRISQLQNRFPDKPILIAEVGWPSEGRTRYEAVASIANQATFLRRFLHLAEEEGYDYFLMEAFDQPWKQTIEGAVGAYWGIYDVKRQPKFPFTGEIVKIPEWQSLVTMIVALGILIIGLILIISPGVTNSGRMVMSTITYFLISLVTWLSYDYLTPYITTTGILSGSFLFLFMLGMAVLFMSETHEWMEAYWVRSRRRPGPELTGNKLYFPKVSIHVPTFNEPPAMVIQTLNALANLNYPDFEVIVVDNNTKDEDIWRPVEIHCKELGDRFIFHHVDPLSGFKAGALNYALKCTHINAEVIAVIDSDYIVDQNWLQDLVPAFSNPRISIVQAPQDYRDGDQNAFKSMCYSEYKGFFEIGMVTRNDRNAIIQHGTMTLVRKKTLEHINGWAEWCITEDTELGLRVFEEGLEASYTPSSYGRGLIPDTFLDYKKQRYRWAYGAVQILKHHLHLMLRPGASQLTMGQRYHFIAGWLPWFAQSINLLFSVFAIAWSVGMMYSPNTFEVPHLAFSIFPILFFGFNLVKLFHLYYFKLQAGVGQTLAAAIASLSLSFTIGKAMMMGLVTSNQPFIRTPKQVKPHAISVAIKSACEELLFFITFVIAILTLMTLPLADSPDLTLWLTLLGIQSIPYGAAFMTSMISAWQLPAKIFEQQASTGSNYAPETND